MSEKKFEQIRKHNPHTWKNVLWVLIGVVALLVIGYFIFTGFGVG